MGALPSVTLDEQLARKEEKKLCFILLEVERLLNFRELMELYCSIPSCLILKTCRWQMIPRGTYWGSCTTLIGAQADLLRLKLYE